MFRGPNAAIVRQSGQSRVGQHGRRGVSPGGEAHLDWERPPVRIWGFGDPTWCSWWFDHVVQTLVVQLWTIDGQTMDFEGSLLEPGTIGDPTVRF